MRLADRQNASPSATAGSPAAGGSGLCSATPKSEESGMGAAAKVGKCLRDVQPRSSTSPYKRRGPSACPRNQRLTTLFHSATKGNGPGRNSARAEGGAMTEKAGVSRSPSQRRTKPRPALTSSNVAAAISALLRLPARNMSMIAFLSRASSARRSRSVRGAILPGSLALSVRACVSAISTSCR